jgi:phosphatidylinositol 4-phosphatase
VVITKSKPVGRLKGHMVYKVLATEFLPLRERALHDADEDAYHKILNNLLHAGPLYFSYTLDLTNSFQRQARSDLSAPMWKRADDRFFWNRYMQSDLINFRTGAVASLRQQGQQQPGVDPYILPVMFGMMRISPASLKGVHFTFTLITRRSRYRAGTRYFSRGIDEDGHVSNFNETEQIVVLNDNQGGPSGFAGGGEGLPDGRVARDGKEVQILSYIQTRGSVPVYWAEINNLHYVPGLDVRDVESAVGAARRHFDEQIDLYGENYLVNLVNQKGRERRVKEAYEQMVRVLVSSPFEEKHADAVTTEKLHIVEPAGTKAQNRYNRLHYVYFDFHNETKGLRWHRALALLEQLRSGLVEGGYFRAVDMPGSSTTGELEVRSTQAAVVRTNCMDCLDRTNVVQTMLARWTLTRQLTDAGMLRSGESQDDDPAFAHLFRNVWADNADAVSKPYSGTGALKTDFTRTNRRTRRGMMQDLNNSITRYIRNNFLDGPRQDAYDVWTGAFEPPANLGGPSIFADRRPLAVQAVPYLLAASVFLVLLATLTRAIPGGTAWPMRIFILFWLVVGVYSWHFVYSHGTLYVSISLFSFRV